MGEGGGGEALSLFAFIFPLFPQKRLILRLLNPRLNCVGQLGGGGDGRTDGHMAPKLLQPRPQGVFVFQYGELTKSCSGVSRSHAKT